MIVKFKQLERPRDFCQSFFVFANWTEKCRISMLSRQYFDLNFAGRPTLPNGRNWLFAGATLELEHKELRHISKRIAWLIFYKLFKILLKISVRMFKVMKVKILSGNSMKNEVWFVKYYVLPWPSFWAWLTIQSLQFTFQLASLHSRRQTTFFDFPSNFGIKGWKVTVSPLPFNVVCEKIFIRVRHCL